MDQKNECYLLFVLMLFPCFAEASEHCSEWLAKVISIQGKVDTQPSGESTWQSVSQEGFFCSGDKIRTSKNSRATIQMRNESRLTLDQGTTMVFLPPEKKESSWYLDLLEGKTFIRSRQPQRLNIETPFINAVHKGTEFLVAVTSRQTEITVFDGQVAATNQLGEIQIKKGFTGIATKSQPPHVKAINVRPEDAVQWTLYYPPIIDVNTLEYINEEKLQSAINAYQQGSITQALTQLDKVSASEQNTSYLILKASLLLTVGSVEDALILINKVQDQEPDNSTAIALKSIIAVTKNRQDSALSLAQKAVKLNPQSAVAQIALSYAYQSKFNIELALRATQKAVRLSPDNALAWARLSELQLSTGERSDALESAKKAQALNPQLDRTQTILGFAYLADVDVDEAKTAFNQAINLNTADPLARLGLGLAKIRKGDIEEGTRDLETAVSLDPDNAVMRSYLGKAYYELKDNSYAETELSIAKEKDPNDPTPWFYDAIRKQTTNRPVEALYDMQKAIELNDNRAIYRSRLLLDEDAAAKSANMARIYQNLDFDRVALRYAWTSLTQDYTNPSAHRFLSDTLQGKPRQRIARASELLQAQLFQPINIIPVQPQLTSENISILNSTGPGSLSSNEYDPLFASNGAHILLNGAIGSNNTLTDNAIITGLYDQVSLSFGQFHFQTDGFRENDDYKQNVYNAFAQAAITQDLNMQVEFKKEDVTAGDVPLRFNNFHEKNLRQSVDQDTARFGLRYKIDTQQDFIFSAIHSNFNESENNLTTQEVFRPFLTIIKNNVFNNIEQSVYQVEAQHLFNSDKLNSIFGVGYNNLKSELIKKSIREQTLTNPITGELDEQEPKILTESSEPKQSYFNAYIYSKYQALPSLTTILGLSFDSIKKPLIDRKQVNPKVGLIWNPIDKLTLRAAAFRTLKRPLAINQTIEPTQVAGFNQFFDGNNGTRAWQYGIGIDIKPAENLYMGGELFWRNATELISNTETLEPNKIIAKSRDRQEASHIAYINWTPADWLAISTKYQYDVFANDFTIGKGNKSLPRKTLTHFVPSTLNFFHPNGAFAKLTANYINQKTEFVRPEEEFDGSGTDFLEIESDDFWTFDAVLGYRLPKKIGFISLEVRNLFDNKGFNYNSVFDASGPQLTRFVPEREIFCKINLYY